MTKYLVLIGLLSILAGCSNNLSSTGNIANQYSGEHTLTHQTIANGQKEKTIYKFDSGRMNKLIEVCSNGICKTPNNPYKFRLEVKVADVLKFNETNIGIFWRTENDYANYIKVGTFTGGYKRRPYNRGSCRSHITDQVWNIKSTSTKSVLQFIYRNERSIKKSMESYIT